MSMTLRPYQASKGLSDGWAFYATQRRYKLDADAAKRIIAWAWRHDEPLVPDAETSRWFRADFQRYRIAARHSNRSAAHA